MVEEVLQVLRRVSRGSTGSVLQFYELVYLTMVKHLMGGEAGISSYLVEGTYIVHTRDVLALRVVVVRVQADDDRMQLLCSRKNSKINEALGNVP